jgi:hypothetical protein
MRGPIFGLVTAVAVLFVLSVGLREARGDLLLSYSPDPLTFFERPLGSEQLITVNVLLQTATSVQAFDLDVHFDPALLKAVVTNGHVDYDGDSSLLWSPVVDNATGTIRGLVDARLGAPGPNGLVDLATLVFRVLQPGEANFSYTAFSSRKGFADAAGNALAGQADQGPLTVVPYVDSDLDLLPDDFEVLVLGTDPNKLDSNLDGLSDTLEDADLDGVINYLEYLQGSDPQVQDSDGDGVADLVDNCPTTSNPGQADGDGDGTGNVCDPDKDEDQLEDVDEPALGLDPMNPDTDGDGSPDGVEIAAGTDPLDPQSFPSGVPALSRTGWFILGVLVALREIRRFRRERRIT